MILVEVYHTQNIMQFCKVIGYKPIFHNLYFFRILSNSFFVNEKGKTRSAGHGIYTHGHIYL
jgi:hypothetical protein